jgi:hypothetical protein
LIVFDGKRTRTLYLPREGIRLMIQLVAAASPAKDYKRESHYDRGKHDYYCKLDQAKACFSAIAGISSEARHKFLSFSPAVLKIPMPRSCRAKIGPGKLARHKER